MSHSAYESQLITVIIPIYNSEKYLDRCLSSVMSQSYRNLQVVLVDDGSTDNSIGVCEKYCRRDERFLVVRQSNGGPNAARKRGLDIADGSMTVFVDSDDWIESNMIERMAHLHEMHKCDLVSTPFVREDEAGNIVTKYVDLFEEGLHTLVSTSVYPKMLWNYEHSAPGIRGVLYAKLFRTNTLRDIYNSIDLRVFYGEDTLVLMQYCLSIDSIYFEKVVYYHRVDRHSSISFSLNEEVLMSNHYLINGLKQTFSQSEYRYSLERQLPGYIINLEQIVLRQLYAIKVDAFTRWVFNYDIFFDSRIVIYGAGLCGRALFNRMTCMGKENNVIKWVDREGPLRADECHYEVDYPNSISQIGFDYVLLALESGELAEKVREYLITEVGISSSQIIWKEIKREKSFI